MKKTLLACSFLALLLSTTHSSAQTILDEANGVVSRGVYQIEGSPTQLYLRLDHDIMRSDDGALTWHPLELPDNLTGRLNGITVEQGILWVASSSGLFRYEPGSASLIQSSSRNFSEVMVASESLLLGVSADRTLCHTSSDGTDWSLVEGPEGILSVRQGSDGALWISAENGVFNSTDNGTSWQTFPSPEGAAPITYLHAFDNGEMLALGTGKIWQSDRINRGWRETGTMPEHDSVVTLFQFFHQRVFGLVVANPNDSIGTTAYISGDTGRGWTGSTLALQNHDDALIHDVHFVHDTTRLLGLSTRDRMDRSGMPGYFAQLVSADESGSFRDGAIATYSSSLAHSQISGIVPLEEGKLIASRRIHQSIRFEIGDWLYRSEDRGRTWSVLPLSEETGVVSRARNGTMYLTGEEDLVRSRNGGDSWDTITTSVSPWNPLGEVLDGGDFLFLASTSPEYARRYHLSLDDGETWETRSIHPVTGVMDDGIISPDATIYVLVGNRLQISQDTGRTWITMEYDRMAGMLLGQDGYPLLMSTSGVLVSVRNLGAVRVELGTIVDGFNDPGIRSIAMSESGEFFAGSHDGRVWHSRDNGASWRVGAEIPGTTTEILVMEISPEGILYLGTLSRGIWRLDIDQIGSTEGEIATPEQLDLR